MDINKNMNSLNIRQFKLLNGEEIIALVSEKTESGSYIIERPFKINYGMIGGFYFVPWFAFSSQKLFKLHQGKIIYHVEIDEDIKEEYIKLAKDGMRPRPKTKLRSADELMNELAEEMDAELASEEYKEIETIH
jgi:3-dehydroquinate synthase class II